MATGLLSRAFVSPCHPFSRGIISYAVQVAVAMSQHMMFSEVGVTAAQGELHVRRILMDSEDSHLRTTADLWLINSCTVKSPSQSQMASVINEAKRHSIPVVVAGCVPQGDKKSADLEV